MAHKKPAQRRGTAKRLGRGGNGDPKFTLPLQQKFCELFQAGGTVAMAARKCGVSSVTVYHRARTDENFKAMYEAALELNTDDLESLLHQLARAGNIAALFGTLKARRPERWRDNFKVDHQHTFLTTAEDLTLAQQRAKLREPVPPPEARH